MPHTYEQPIPLPEGLDYLVGLAELHDPEAGAWPRPLDTSYLEPLVPVVPEGGNPGQWLQWLEDMQLVERVEVDLSPYRPLRVRLVASGQGATRSALTVRAMRTTKGWARLSMEAHIPSPLIKSISSLQEEVRVRRTLDPTSGADEGNGHDGHDLGRGLILEALSRPVPPGRSFLDLKSVKPGVHRRQPRELALAAGSVAAVAAVLRHPA